MSKKLNIKLITAIVLCGFITTMTVPAMAQLILVDFLCTITEVHRGDDRLVISVHSGTDREIQYVIIDQNTRFFNRHRSLDYDQAWSMFRPGMRLRVKGGYTMGLHVKAKEIFLREW